MNVLIVENSRFYQQILSKLILDAGATATFTETGASAIEMLKSSPFDMVCFALHLQDMNGIHFCKQARTLQSAKNIPFILLTSADSNDTYSESLKSGVTEVFNKADSDRFALYLKEVIQEKSFRPMHGKVLIIEDSKFISDMVAAYVNTLGLSSDQFTTGEEALKSFAINDYDLIVTDIILEGKMNGMAVVREVRRIGNKKQRTPILAMSGMDDVARKIELLKSGANDFISKPLNEDELITRVKNLVVNKQLMDTVEIQQAQLLEMAMTDQLTRLYNRHYLSDIAPKKINESYANKQPLSLLIVDLDHFKNVNDTYGHASGDVVLKAVADVIHELCKTEGIAARFGGEEFVIVLPQCDLKCAQDKAEKLRKNTEALNPDDIHITASIGIATLPLKHSCDFEALFAAADKAVYEAKESGRNRAVVQIVA